MPHCYRLSRKPDRKLGAHKSRSRLAAPELRQFGIVDSQEAVTRLPCRFQVNSCSLLVTLPARQIKLLTSFLKLLLEQLAIPITPDYLPWVGRCGTPERNLQWVRATSSPTHALVERVKCRS